MKKTSLATILTAIAFSNLSTANADSFIIDSQVTTQQTLDTNSDTGTITSSGQLNTDNTAITISTGTSDTTITNNGSITVANNSRSAIQDSSTSTNSTFINNGVITMQGSSSNAINSSGDSLALTNNGTINIESSSSSAVLSNEGNATIINNGTVNMEGSSSNAILSFGNSATITNNATIITQDSSSSAALSNGHFATINNSGNIATLGSSSTAIISTGEGAVINNSGSIIAQGASSTAISIGDAAATTLINSGSIKATGTSGSAIIAGSGSTNVTLAKGSQIIGAIDLGSGTDSINVTGNGISGRIVTSNVDNISLAPNVAGTVSGGNTINTVDPTSLASLTIATNNLTNFVSNAVNSQINLDKKGKIWTKIFDSSFERGDDNNNIAYDHDYKGAVVGYELGSKSGIIIGLSSGKIKTNSQSLKSDVNSFFIGAYKGLELAKSTFLNLNLIAGYEKYKNQRTVVDNINAVENARSDIENLFFTPSVEILHKIKLGENFQLTPSASANYSSAFFSKSHETGTTAANMTIASRNARIFNAKAGISGSLILQKNYRINLGLGLDHRKISEDKARANIAGSNFSFATNNDNNVNGRYFNLGFDVINVKNLNLGFQLEKRFADGGEEQKSMSFNAGYKF